MRATFNKYLLKYLLYCCLTLGSLGFAAPASTFQERSDVQQFIATLVSQYHFTAPYLTSLFAKIEVDPRVISSISHPYEKKPWDLYRARFVTEERIKEGARYWHEHPEILQKAHEMYGVPVEIIVAILGAETFYGRIQGNYSVLNTLATLAFDYPKRAPFFKKELTEFLLLCREYQFDPSEIKGSYAGAIGQPQFMPSSYRYYAIDSEAKGRSDLRNNPHDIVLSIANYLKKNGWQTDLPIADPVKTTGELYKTLAIDSKKPLYSVASLRSQGIKPLWYDYPNDLQASLIRLDNTNNAEYWMVFPNFFSILRYNTSPQYAMAVFLLSEEIRKQYIRAYT